MLLASNRISTPAPTSVICRGVREETEKLQSQLYESLRKLTNLIEEMQHDNTASCARPEPKE